jgi:NAD(P)-dependent dehydrogenase (short-subunit alcohol dehydrogenase family)
MSTLTGKVALITGAQQGIGAAIARACAHEGAAVVVNWLDDQAGAETVAADIRAAGRKAELVRGSVTEPTDIEAMLATADQLGGVDVLVNNAAIFPRVDFLKMTTAEWDDLMAVNLRGPFLCAQAAAKRMVAAKKSGAIVSISSGAAFRGSPRGAHYVASKAGVIGLTRALALELAPYSIRANAIAPGLVDTAQPRYGMTEEEIAATGATYPLPGVLQPMEIADAAVFLASDAARKITGQTLHVNAGSYLW